MRRRLNSGGGAYFPSSSGLNFVHTGCTVLDLVMGNGWPLGRVVNVVGDQSSGKTLLAIEAMVSFAKKYPKGKICYHESEAAFSESYASALGLPLDRIDFCDSEGTVEGFYRDVDKFLKKLGDQPGLYILDSLDALSDESELKRDLSEGSYGVGKAKQISQLFRRLAGKIEDSQVCLVIISQTRDRIGVSFGRKYSRSGGRALDFYASVVVYLAHIKEISRTIRGVKRSFGVEIKARCTKNKIGLPFRSCTFPIVFGYGVEDVTAGLDWLAEHKMLDSVGLTLREYKELRSKALHIKLAGEDHLEWQIKVSKAVRKGWRSVETSFMPNRSKHHVD